MDLSDFPTSLWIGGYLLPAKSCWGALWGAPPWTAADVLVRPIARLGRVRPRTRLGRYKLVKDRPPRITAADSAMDQQDESSLAGVPGPDG